MPRRVSLPAADDLFRPTVVPEAEPEQPTAAAEPAGASEGAETESPDGAGGGGRAGRTANTGRAPSGRVRHDEKMTVYVTAEELLDIEHARLTLRSGHGLAVDRGRLVREAVAIALADLDANGEQSVLVRRLNQG